jgi:hypothetical protein
MGRPATAPPSPAVSRAGVQRASDERVSAARASRRSGRTRAKVIRGVPWRLPSRRSAKRGGPEIRRRAPAGGELRIERHQGVGGPPGRARHRDPHGRPQGRRQREHRGVVVHVELRGGGHGREGQREAGQDSPHPEAARPEPATQGLTGRPAPGSSGRSCPGPARCRSGPTSPS